MTDITKPHTSDDAEWIWMDAAGIRPGDGVKWHDEIYVVTYVANEGIGVTLDITPEYTEGPATCIMMSRDKRLTVLR